jgi:hypothetical protein
MKRLKFEFEKEDFRRLQANCDVVLPSSSTAFTYFVKFDLEKKTAKITTYFNRQVQGVVTRKLRGCTKYALRFKFNHRTWNFL